MHLLISSFRRISCPSSASPWTIDVAGHHLSVTLGNRSSPLSRNVRLDLQIAALTFPGIIVKQRMNNELPHHRVGRGYLTRRNLLNQILRRTNPNQLSGFDTATHNHQWSRQTRQPKTSNRLGRSVYLIHTCSSTGNYSKPCK